MPKLSGAEFKELSLEDQYTIYISSFSHVGDTRGQQTTYARLMVEKYGREVLPFVDKDLQTAFFDNHYAKPYDSTLSLISYIIDYLKESNLLSENEIELYCLIYQAKLDCYILKYKKIDGTVRVATKCINSINDNVKYPYTAEEYAIYFEKRLGIEDITVGNLFSYWEE